jgi:16S rRNA (cytidine1402-2'-O)-methyltransferase
VVATPIGNLEDITLRALRVLGAAPIIAAEDTRAAQHLLSRHGLYPRIGAELQLRSLFTGNEAQRTEELLGALRDGQDVALISQAGAPLVSDPGARLVQAAIAAGLKVEVVPGPSAVVAALMGAGLPAERFLFLGFPPRQEGARLALFGSLRNEPGTLIFFESPERTGRTLADLAEALGPERPACVARELTKVYEEFVRAPLQDLARRYAETAPRGEVTLVVGGGGGGGAAAALSTEEIERQVRARLASGQGAREIAAALSLQTGLPRRQLYQLVLSARGPRAPEEPEEEGT